VSGPRRSCRALIAGALVAVASLAGATARAQAPSVDYRILPTADPLPAVPRIVIATRNIPAIQRPVTIRLQASDTRSFVSTMLDTAVVGDTVTIVPDLVFPESDSVYLRFSALDVLGRELAQSIAGFRTGPRLSLRSHTGAYGVPEYDRRPTFVWEAAALESPPGPWLFEVTVVNDITGQEAFRQENIVETSLRLPLALEANTPYRWRVRARLGNGPDSIRPVAESPSTFVIQSSDAPRVTLLYQNFPNPFPTEFATRTCIWFDLRRRAVVHLVIRDLRGNHVRTLVNGVSLPAGIYGRLGQGETGCVPELSWDGTTADGRLVPKGVYLVHFRADDVETVRKMLFRGR